MPESSTGSAGSSGSAQPGRGHLAEPLEQRLDVGVVGRESLEQLLERLVIPGRHGAAAWVVGRQKHLGFRLAQVGDQDGEFLVGQHLPAEVPVDEDQLPVRILAGEHGASEPHVVQESPERRLLVPGVLAPVFRVGLEVLGPHPLEAGLRGRAGSLVASVARRAPRTATLRDESI